MNGLSLFSGIGGLDLAFNYAGGNILAFCEIDSFCQKVLHKHWPDVPIFPDIHNVSKEMIRNAGISQAVDIIYGGFPCQPFSVAGKQKKGKEDNRYLWPEFSRLVADFKPRWVVAENVPGILRIAADTVCSDLERQGYKVGIWNYEAAAVGAKHRRERVFFVAHTGRSLLQRRVKQGALRNEAQERTAYNPEQPGCSPAQDNKQCPLRFSQSEFCRGFNGFSTGLDKIISPFASGVRNRTNRLKALGNAVVPQQVFPIFKAIIEIDKENDI